MKSLSFRHCSPPSLTLLRYLRAQRDDITFCYPQRSSPTGSIPRRRYCHSISRNNKICTPRSAPSGSLPFEKSLRFPPGRSKAAHSTNRQGAIWENTFSQCSRPSSRNLHTTRRLSSIGQGDIGRNFWGFSKRRPRTPLEPNDLPQLSSFLGDDTSLGRPLRLANELKLKCTELDENGNVTLVNGEFRKSELIAKYGLLPRDLRKIDSSLLPIILVRPSAILINLLHLRVLIKHNRVLVFDVYGSTDSQTQSHFMYDLEGKLRAPETRTPGSSTVGAALPYEFRALEAVLIAVTSGLEGEFEGVREPIVRVLRELEEDIDRDKLRHLLIYSKKLSSFQQRARLVRDAIDDILEADDDLADMYLTEKQNGKVRSEDDHTEIEMLLESYHKVCDEIVQISGNLVSNIRNTEEIVKAILDANRNSLMLLDLKFSIGTLGLGGGTFVAALYGMNLKNFMEESAMGFWGVSTWSTVFSIIVCWIGLRKLRRVQRLSMWGQERGERTRGRGGWARLGDKQSDPSVKTGKIGRASDVKDDQGLSSRNHETTTGATVSGKTGSAALQRPYTPITRSRLMSGPQSPASTSMPST